MTQENTNNDSRLAFFEKELNLIKNENVKKLTSKLLIEAPQWFFTKFINHKPSKIQKTPAKRQTSFLLHTKIAVHSLLYYKQFQEN